MEQHGMPPQKWSSFEDFVRALVPGQIALGLYDTAGRLVERTLARTVEAGVPLTLSWQAGSDITPGLYRWRLEAGALSTGRAMVLVR